MSKRILFFGNERLATGVTTTTPTLRYLIKAGYNVVAVVVAQREPSHSSRQNRELEIIKLAEEHAIPVLAPPNLKDAKDELAAFGAEAAVLVAYGKLVPQAIIDIFPTGIINIHPSLLPKHRGPTPIESFILAEQSAEYTTGVSLMRLTAKRDAGPIYVQEKIGLATYFKQDLADTLLGKGADLLIKNLPAIVDGSLKPVEQDDSAATYDHLIHKEDGVIDWNKSAAQLEREVRAYAGWPRSQTNIVGKEVIITKAKVLDSVGPLGTLKPNKGSLVIFCKWGALQIESLIPAGKKEMTAAAFLAGYKPTSLLT